MANPAKILTLTDKEVAFAIVTGEGRKGKKAENEYVVGIEVDAKERKKIIKELTEFFNDNKTAKVDKPAYAFEDSFTESKTNKGGYVFWASETVGNGITYKVAPGTGFTIDNFAKMGSGSVVDLEIRAFYFNNSYGEGLGLRLSAVLLKEFKAYTGGGGATLEGDTLNVDGTQVASSVSDDAAEDDPDVEDFLEALDDHDWDEAKEILKELKDHPDYKKFKKQLRKAKS